VSVPLDRAIPPRPVMRLRRGTIVGEPVGGTCTVDVGGTQVADVPYIHQPSEADVVHILQDGAVLLVLGHTADDD